VIEDGWTTSYAAAVFNLSWPTASAGHGATDRPSRPG